MSASSVLVLVGRPQLGSGQIARLKELAASHAKIVAWQHPPIVQERYPSPDIAGALERLGITSVSLTKVLGEQTGVEVDETVIDWMKELGREPLTDSGESFRSLFRYRHLSLWWWAELFLYHDTPLRLLVRDIEALARLVEQEQPDRLVVIAPVRDIARVSRHLVREVEVHGETIPARSRFESTSGLFITALFKMMGTGLKGLFRRRSVPAKTRRRYLFLTHASMWRQHPHPETGEHELVEMYFDRIPGALVSAGDEVKLVAVGPPIPFRQRRFTDKVKDVLELETDSRPYVSIRNYFAPFMSFNLVAASWRCWKMWRRFRRLSRLDDALTHRGVFLGQGALESFRDTFLLQLPWAIRAYHEVRTVLLEEEPDTLVLYAESSGLGRAAIAAAHELGISTFAIQHGIMYPRYYSHDHADHEVRPEADGADSVPLPSRTAVFGSLAKDLLVSRGHHPPERIVITGSPKFDALVEAARGHNPEATRARLGIEKDALMLVAATRFSAIGPVFEDLVRAVETIPELWLVVKPHQAEFPEPYRRVVNQVGSARTLVISADENLLELLVASNGLITVDSLASSEALVLGRPVLVVNLPSNLLSLVERGVALGAWQGESISDRLREMLFDREIASELEKRRRQYIWEFAFGADGKSTERIVQALRETAELDEKFDEKKT